MKTLPSYEQVNEMLEFKPDTGVLTWRASRGRVRAGTTAGYLLRNGYVQIRIMGRGFQAHRLAWLLAIREWPKGEIDHVDGDRANNRLANLRDVSHSVNKQNLRRAHFGNASGFLGVAPDRSRWRAKICVGGEAHYLGMFDSPEAAHAAYIEAKRKLHPGCVI